MHCCKHEGVASATSVIANTVSAVATNAATSALDVRCLVLYGVVRIFDTFVGPPGVLALLGQCYVSGGIQ